jgi:glycosyltransferase involved in cell wall biosynthesis
MVLLYAMKVSIIIPAYNEEMYIEKTVRAALAQDFEDFEVVVVNNNSKDKTLEILENVKDPKLKVVTENKQGLLFARKRGQEESTGEIIAQLDADCIPDTNWLKVGMKYFENKDIVGLSSIYKFYDHSTLFNTVSYFFQKYIYYIAYFITNVLFKRGMITGGNAFIRRTALEAIGGYDTSIVFYGEDTDLARRLSSQGKMRFDTKIAVKSSARRFKELGVLKVFYLYVINYFSIHFVKRPSHNKYDKI